MASQNNLSKFLDAYKALETAIRNNSSLLGRLPFVGENCVGIASVRDLEDAVTDEDLRDKLRLCRMVRNYAQHHDDASSFVGISDGMLSFVQSMAKTINLVGGSYKDCMTKYTTPLTAQSTPSECAKALLKSSSDWLPVVDGAKKPAGIIDKDGVLECLAASKRTIRPVVKTDSGVKIVNQSDPLPEDQSSCRKIVLNTKGTVAGYVN